MSGKKEELLALLSKSDKCHWCGRKVKYYGMIPDGHKNPDDMATRDHLLSKFYRKKGEVVEKVLSCRKCNHERGQKDESNFGRRYDK